MVQALDAARTAREARRTSGRYRRVSGACASFFATAPSGTLGQNSRASRALGNVGQPPHHGSSVHHFAKKVGKGALSASGPTTVEHPIPRRTQRADIRHDPDPARVAERALLGLLGRIAEILCLIEIYGHALDAGELRACLCKHFAHWEAYVLRMRAENRKRKAMGLDPEPLIKPMLWILAVTVSGPMLRKLRARTKPGWPPGVYFWGDDLFRVGIIVASELPRDRTTLLVRFMVAGALLPDAIADLATLPEDAVERSLVEGDLVDLERVLVAKPSRTPEEEGDCRDDEGNVHGCAEDGPGGGPCRGGRPRRADGAPGSRHRRVGRRPQAHPGRADRETLERWHERAILAASVVEVLVEPSRAA